MKPKSALRRSLSVLPFATALVTTATAANLTWDADTVSPGAQDGAGTWSAGPNWYNADTLTDNQSFTNGDAVTFGAGSGTAGVVTVSGTVQTSALTFNAAGGGTYTLSGGTAINLSGTTNTIATNADTTITTLVSRSSPLVKTGTGTLAINSPSTGNDGTITISQGRLNFNSVSALGAAAANTITLGDTTSGAAPLTLNFTGESTTTLTTVNNLVVSANGTGEVRIGRTTVTAPTPGNVEHVFSGTLTLGRSVTLFNASAGQGQSRFSGAITGTGNVTIDSVGSTLPTVFRQANNANTFAGDLILAATGALQLGTNDTGTTNHIPNTSNVIFKGPSSAFRLSNAGETIAALVSDVAGAGVVGTNRTTAGGGSVTLTLSAASGRFDFSGTLTDQAANAASWKLNIAKSGQGTQKLSGSNSSNAGITTLVAGTLEVMKLANGGSNSSIGKADSTAGTLVFNGGTLSYVGAGDGTDRLFTLAAAAAILSNGTSPLTFASTGTLAHTNPTIHRTLTLGGENTGENTFNPLIGDAGTGKTSVTKAGAGKWILTGTHGYTGTTAVNGGTLVLQNTSALADASSVSLSATGTLQLDLPGTDTIKSLTIDNLPQLPGKWGRIGSMAALGADFETDRITGDGLLQTTSYGGTFFWDATATSWGTLSAWSLLQTGTVPDPFAIPDASQAASFGIDGITEDLNITLDGDRVAQSLAFTSPVVVSLLGGDASHTLTLGTGGLATAAASAGVTLGSATAGQGVAVVLAGPQGWTNAAISQVTVNNSVALGAYELALGGAGSFSFNGAITDSGSVRKLGTGAVEFLGACSFTGDKTLDRGTAYVEGDQSLATGSWILRGYGDTGTAYNTVVTTATLASGSTSIVASGRSVQAGNSTANGGFQIQTLTANGTMTNNGTLLCGRSSVLNIGLGGNWTQNGTATIAAQGGGVAAVNVRGGGSFAYASATPFVLRSSGSTNCQTNLTVDGGTFITGMKIHNDATTVVAGTSSAVILSNGGTLKLATDVADLLTTAGATVRFEMGTGGGTVHTNGFATTLNVPLSGVGGLLKDGVGTLTTTQTNSYSGDTAVVAGVLSLVGPNLNDASAVTIAAAAKLDLNFTGFDQIAALTLGGNPQGPGTYNATTHPAFFSGSGSLVVSVTDPFVAWIASFFPGETTAAIIGKAADPDGDGVSNGLEFLTAGIPNNPADKGYLWIGTSGNRLVLSLAIRGDATTFAGSPGPAATVDGITATIEGSTTLAGFASPVSGIGFVQPAGWPASPPASHSYHSFTLDASTGLPDSGFLRLKGAY